jgi:general secretion pathway protein J
MRAPRGFTLIEVMVALLIFAMIAAAGVGILAFSVRAQAATDAKLGEVAGLARLSAALSADLAQAMDRPTRDPGGTLRPAFAGDATGPVFVRGGRASFDTAARPTLQKVTWRREGDAVVRQGWPMLDGAAPGEAAVMMAGVRSIAWRYRTAGVWTDRFEGTPTRALPQAAEIVVTRQDGTSVRALFYVGVDPRPAGEPANAPEN